MYLRFKVARHVFVIMSECVLYVCFMQVACPFWNNDNDIHDNGKQTVVWLSWWFLDSYFLLFLSITLTMVQESDCGEQTFLTAVMSNTWFKNPTVVNKLFSQCTGVVGMERQTTISFKATDVNDRLDNFTDTSSKVYILMCVTFFVWTNFTQLHIQDARMDFLKQNMDT